MLANMVLPVTKFHLSTCFTLLYDLCMAPELAYVCVCVSADNPEGPMQHRSADGKANGVLNGHANGYDAEAAKVASSATKQVVQGLRATAAAFTPSKATTPASSTVASVGDC